MAIFYTPSCQTEVGGHIVYVMGITMMSLLGIPQKEAMMTFIPSNIDSAISISCDFDSKSPQQKNCNPGCRYTKVMLLLLAFITLI